MPSRITLNPTTGKICARHSFLHTENWMSKQIDWYCMIIDYQDQVFLLRSLVQDTTFYAFMYILGDVEEAKKSGHDRQKRITIYGS